MKHFYCDASSNKDHRYMVAGGFVLDGSSVRAVEEALNSIKQVVPNCGELKWAKYRGGERARAYRGVIDYMFDLLVKNAATLHVLVADFGKLDHRRHDTAEDGTVNRLYYQLFLHSLCKVHGGGSKIIAYPDMGTDSAEVIGFRNPICAAAYRKYSTLPNCLVDIRPINSASSSVMQATDIVIGAIAASQNNIISKREKIELAAYVQERSKHPDWSVDTLRSRKDITVWNFKPRNNGAR